MSAQVGQMVSALAFAGGISAIMMIGCEQRLYAHDTHASNTRTVRLSHRACHGRCALLSIAVGVGSAPSQQHMLVRAQSDSTTGSRPDSAMKPRLTKHPSGAFIPRSQPEDK